MKYRCLVFDHDDTTVDSTRNLHYPSFVEFMKIYRPEISMSLEEYVRYNFAPGIIPLFKEMCGLSDEEIVLEEQFWNQYCQCHRARAFDGISEIMRRHKENGGIIAVVSHSYRENIIRDYEYNALPDPDIIFGWEQPKAERKPSPASIYTIMEKFDLKPEEILVIDDLKPGFDMAKAAGVDFAAAMWCFDIAENKKFMKENADFYFESVSELMTFCQL